MNQQQQDEEQRILDYLSSGQISRSAPPEKGQPYRVVWVDPSTTNILKQCHQIIDLRGRRIIVEKFDFDGEFVTDCVAKFRSNSGKILEIKIKSCKLSSCATKNTNPVDLDLE